MNGGLIHASFPKWDHYRERDILPMWIADADVPPAPVITESLICRTKSGAPFGYTRATDGVRAAVVSHIASFSPPDFIPKKELAYPPRPSQLFFLPGLIQGLIFSCGINEPGQKEIIIYLITTTPVSTEVLSSCVIQHTGSAVMVFTPIYPPFLWAPERVCCTTVEVTLSSVLLSQ